MNSSIVEVVVEAVLELALVLEEPDNRERPKVERIRIAADRVVTMCGGDAVTAVVVAACLIDPDAPVRDWRSVMTKLPAQSRSRRV